MTRIVPVEGRRDRRRFLAFGPEAYEDVPAWVPPDSRGLEALFAGRSALAAESRWQAFFAEVDGEVVGRLCAFRHPAMDRRIGKAVATFGYFEALPGHEAAIAELFREACDWARDEGARRVLGPVNGLFVNGMGCLENCHNEVPTIGTAYGRSDYPTHWWRQGFRKAPSFYSYEIGLESAVCRRGLESAKALPKADGGDVHFRVANTKAWRREVGIFTRIHNEAFAERWGEAEFSEAVAWDLLGLGRFACDPELFWIAEIDGEAIGMVFASPDWNQLLHPKRRNPASLRGGLAIWLRGSRVTRGALFAVGVLPQARGRNIGTALAARVFSRMRERGMDRAEYCAVEESNEASQGLVRHFGGQHTKTYLLFEKSLGAEESRPGA